MQNLPEQECVLKIAQPAISAESCAAVNFESFGNFEVDRGDGKQTVKATINKVIKFSANSYKKVALSEAELAQDGSLRSIFEASTCACSNYVLETHYKIYFTETDPQQDGTSAETDPQEQLANNFFIERIEGDDVYGDIKELTCNSGHTFSIKTSLTYL